jgi:MFS family permease
MRALRVISIAVLTAISGAVLSVVASLYLTELYHVSDFEGGRGMLIFFALAPLGLIVGFLIGLVVALRSRGTGFAGFARAQDGTWNRAWTGCCCFRRSLSRG